MIGSLEIIDCIYTLSDAIVDKLLTKHWRVKFGIALNFFKRFYVIYVIDNILDSFDQLDY